MPIQKAFGQFAGLQQARIVDIQLAQMQRQTRFFTQRRGCTRQAQLQATPV